MQKKRIIIILFSFVFLSSLLANSDSITIKLEDAIELALQNNLDIIISKYRIDISKDNIIKRESGFDPALTSSVSYRDGITSNQSEASIGIRKIFFSGSDISLQHSLQHSDNAVVSDPYTASLSLTIRQPLLKNRGNETNRTFLKIEYNNHTITELNLKQRILTTLSDIQKTYWDIVYYNELYKVKEQTLKLAEELYDNNKTKVELGLLPKIELTRAAASVAAQQEGIIIAENNILNIQDIFLNRINAFDNPHFRNKKLLPADSPEPVFEVPDFFESINFCFENNPDYIKLKKEIENNNIRLEYYNNQKLPSLDFVSTLSANGIDNTLGSSYGNLTNFDETSWQVGLSLSIPLGNRSAKADYNTAKINKLLLIADFKKMENNLSLEVQSAIRNIEASIKRIRAAETSVKLAKENLEAEMNRFELQQTTTYDILQYQEALDNEKSRLLKAIIDNQIAVIEYENLLGGIVIE